MEKRYVTAQLMERFEAYLIAEERSAATRENYLRGVRMYAVFLDGREASGEETRLFKERLREKGYAAGSVNTVLASLAALFRFLGWDGCGAKRLRTQKRTFCPEERVLSKKEYERLVRAASAGRERLLVETLGSTGIRVSELRWFTVEAVRRGEVEVTCKAKTRQILLPGKLKKSLLAFARRQGLTTGPIFLGKNGQPLSRGSIWAAMKRLAKRAGVALTKVFPHNLRKLFARTFYALDRDIGKLADLLGHSSIDTTRIYIMTTGAEHRRAIDRLNLIL